MADDESFRSALQVVDARQSRGTLSNPRDEPLPSPNTRSRTMTSVACSPGPSIRVRQLHLGEPEPPVTEIRPKHIESIMAEPLGEPPSPSAPTSARCSRLNVRDNRKEAIATSMTLDFVSLDRCGSGMVKECDDGHSHVEALKRKRDVSLHVSLACHETVPSTKRGSVVPPTAPSPPKSECLSSSEGQSLCASEIRGLVPKRIKLPLPKNPGRPQSSRGSDTSHRSPGASSECFSSVPSWPRRPGSLGPPSTTGSSIMWAPGSFPPPRLLSSRHVDHGSECGQGHSRMGSTHGSISESLSSFMGQSRSGMGTPPCAPNAFEAHQVLVKCPAPRRGPVLAPSALSQRTNTACDAFERE